MKKQKTEQSECVGNLLQFRKKIEKASKTKVADSIISLRRCKIAIDSDW